MLVLFETAAGYGLFKVKDESKVLKAEPSDLEEYFQTPEKASKILKLKAFQRFQSTADALEATTALLDGELSKSLSKFLKKEIVDKELEDKLITADTKMGGLISKKLKIEQFGGEKLANELMRGIRTQLHSLVGDLSTEDNKAMSLGLAHSLSRYKLKFSPDKVDTMIVQAISLLDDLDKELNTYAMRAREWYGWHFPELSRVIPENTLFAKTVKLMGIRTNALTTDFSDFLPEEMADTVKDVAQISMGTEISEEDITNIKQLCDQVIALSEYREQLFDYLKNRMTAIAPNLSTLVGELVGARLISHAGSLLSLAKHPASTVQILGAEKALFRALKTKNSTPKYGIIYHASLLGQTTPKNKGKIARLLGARAALAVRYDALNEGETDNSVGLEGREKVENRIKALEGQQSYKASGSGKAQFNLKPYKATGAKGVKEATNGGQNDYVAKSAEKKPKKEEKKKEESESEEEEKPKKKAKKAKEESESEEEEKPKKKKKEEKKKEEKKEEKKEKKKSKKEESESEEEKPKKKRKQESSDSEEEKPKKKKKPKLGRNRMSSRRRALRSGRGKHTSDSQDREIVDAKPEEAPEVHNLKEIPSALSITISDVRTLLLLLQSAESSLYAATLDSLIKYLNHSAANKSEFNRLGGFNVLKTLLSSSDASTVDLRKVILDALYCTLENIETRSSFVQIGLLEVVSEFMSDPVATLRVLSTLIIIRIAEEASGHLLDIVQITSLLPHIVKNVNSEQIELKYVSAQALDDLTQSSNQLRATVRNLGGLEQLYQVLISPDNIPAVVLVALKALSTLLREFQNRVEFRKRYLTHLLSLLIPMLSSQETPSEIFRGILHLFAVASEDYTIGAEIAKGLDEIVPDLTLTLSDPDLQTKQIASVLFSRLSNHDGFLQRLQTIDYHMSTVDFSLNFGSDDVDSTYKVQMLNVIATNLKEGGSHLIEDVLNMTDKSQENLLHEPVIKILQQTHATRDAQSALSCLNVASKLISNGERMYYDRRSRSG
ncbi:nucleolar protein 58 [Planoprotostelium fungivorum]|uniref:Nucleolar protein 58 n=1 Tax=Planoprotostelium fungivorum TaxID=1890364 RepID=A0A2P6NSF1_9EUKA|nr:nucleolar protein 58 [Planoprotostelium fungivorum]